MTDDPLDGFRATVVSVAGHIHAADPNPSNALWQRLYLGDAASKIMRGVAEREDIARVLAMMIAQCELDVQASCRSMIAEEDVTSAASRKAHFDARIAAGILGRMNQYINDGATAAEQINSKGES